MREGGTGGPSLLFFEEEYIVDWLNGSIADLPGLLHKMTPSACFAARLFLLGHPLPA